MRNECRRGPKVVADFSLVDVSRKRVCSRSASNILIIMIFFELTRQKVILEKSLVVLGALLRSSS